MFVFNNCMNNLSVYEPTHEVEYNPIHSEFDKMNKFHMENFILKYDAMFTFISRRRLINL